MLLLATSKSKKPSAQPPDPNIRLGFGETAARRSFFFACGKTSRSCWSIQSLVGAADERQREGNAKRLERVPEASPDVKVLISAPLRRHTGIAAQPLRRHSGVTASLFGQEIVKNSKGE
jgi:hypothetical protein